MRSQHPPRHGLRHPSLLPNRLLALLPLCCLPSTHANDVSPPDVQSIVGFSNVCTAAYSTSLSPCQFSDFLSSVGGSNGGCSSECQATIEEVELAVQTACLGQSAGKDTLIGEMFLGVAVDFLCGSDDDAGAGGSGSTQTQTAATTVQTTTKPSPQSTKSTSATETSGSTENTAQSSSRTSTKGRTTSTQSIATATSVSTTAESSTSATSSSSSDSNSNLTGNIDSGGGSPFDSGNDLNSSAAPSTNPRSLLQSLTVATVAFALGLLLGR